MWLSSHAARIWPQCASTDSKSKASSAISTCPSVRVTDDPSTLEPVDLVLFSVKLWDTEAAARSIKPLFGPHTGIVSFQNGVQKDDMLRRVFGDQAVMGGVCYIATAIARPGVIRHTGKLQRLLFGEYDGIPSARAEALLDACKRAGINAELSADIRREIWEKFAALVATSVSRPWALHHRLDPRPSVDARIPDRPGARGGRGRPRARRQPAGGLCRAADLKFFLRLAAGDDRVDALHMLNAGKPL